MWPAASKIQIFFKIITVPNVYYGGPFVANRYSQRKRIVRQKEAVQSQRYRSISTLYIRSSPGVPVEMESRTSGFSAAPVSIGGGGLDLVSPSQLYSSVTRPRFANFFLSVWSLPLAQPDKREAYRKERVGAQASSREENEHWRNLPPADSFSKKAE